MRYIILNTERNQCFRSPYFSADQSFAGADVDFDETGYSFGLQFIHPLGYQWLSYFVHAGAVVNHISVEDSNGEIIADSQHGFGWQTGTGPSVSIGENWRLMPGVFYRSLSRDIELELAKTPVDLKYFALEISVTKAF